MVVIDGNSFFYRGCKTLPKYQALCLTERKQSFLLWFFSSTANERAFLEPREPSQPVFRKFSCFGVHGGRARSSSIWSGKTDGTPGCSRKASTNSRISGISDDVVIDDLGPLRKVGSGLGLGITSSQRKCSTFTATGDEVPALSSAQAAIFNRGPILPVVHGLRIFQDSKDFVDMCLVKDPEMVLENFLSLIASGVEMNHETVEQFLAANFRDAENEMLLCCPDDWTAAPCIIDKIKSQKGREFTEHLIHQWRNLCRKTKPEISLHQSRYTLLNVHYPFIIPGGRFREYYYWDSFWICQGLLVCDMTVTVRQMIENYISIVQRYGFIPNGGRSYYLTRSQPPLLTLMVHDYFTRTQDYFFLRDKAMPALEKEYQFWMTHRLAVIETESGDHHYLNRYYVPAQLEPRPESYREDVETTSGFSDEEASNMYSEIAAACESGWDFSSRWAADPGTWDGNLVSLATSNVVPVDLNCFMFRIEKLMSRYYFMLGDSLKGSQMLQKAAARQRSVNHLMWNAADGCWYDYDLRKNRQRCFFYPSNVFPLWVDLHRDIHTGQFDDSYELGCVNYLKDHGVVEQGGVITSTRFTGQQWDGRNMWPPLNGIIIESLMKGQLPETRMLGRYLCLSFLEIMMDGYDKHKCMLEKYNPCSQGGLGYGGEYALQVGFGWTNGVALRLLKAIFDSPDRETFLNSKLMRDIFPDLEE